MKPGMAGADAFVQAPAKGGKPGAAPASNETPAADEKARGRLGGALQAAKGIAQTAGQSAFQTAKGAVQSVPGAVQHAKESVQSAPGVQHAKDAVAGAVQSAKDAAQGLAAQVGGAVDPAVKV